MLQFSKSGRTVDSYFISVYQVLKWLSLPVERTADRWNKDEPRQFNFTLDDYCILNDAFEWWHFVRTFLLGHASSEPGESR